MPIYPPKINSRISALNFARQVKNPNAVGTSASFACGCFARMSLFIDVDDKTIRSAGFQTNGCGYMIAGADVIAAYLMDRELTELHSVDEAELMKLVFDHLENIPAERCQCIDVVIEAVRAALADHRAYLIEEYRGEQALICTCYGVSEDTVAQFIAANACESVDEVATALRAGSGCGSCRMLIQEMLDSTDR